MCNMGKVRLNFVIDEAMAQEIQDIVKREKYQSVAEFLRELIRDRIRKEKLKEAIEIAKIKRLN